MMLAIKRRDYNHDYDHGYTTHKEITINIESGGIQSLDVIIGLVDNADIKDMT